MSSISKSYSDGAVLISTLVICLVVSLVAAAFILQLQQAPKSVSASGLNNNERNFQESCMELARTYVSKLLKADLLDAKFSNSSTNAITFQHNIGLGFPNCTVNIEKLSAISGASTGASVGFESSISQNYAGGSQRSKYYVKLTSRNFTNSSAANGVSFYDNYVYGLEMVLSYIK